MVLKKGTLLQDGKYEILRVLGQGGFGITYEAVHVLLGKRVALKEFYMKDVCLRDVNSNLVSVPSLGSGALVEKFKNKFIKEARTIVSLEHPHIVKIHDVFEENGTAYYVMDLLLGGSLAEKVKKEGPLSENVSISYLRQIADALSYIHAHNTVHLDIKPSNILLDANNNAVLIDFGLSKHYDDSGDQTSTTPVGISKGYAPLEQYRDGDISQFKPSTDIYALGATLFFLVTGTAPPEASVVNEDGLERVSTVSETVWKAIVSAMQPKRKERPQTINDFLKCFAVSKTECRTVVSNDADSEDTQIITKEVGVLNGYDWVDLGLPSGTKWATRNIGANSPEEYGNYYAWGETAEKKRYYWSTYKFLISDKSGPDSFLQFSKYNTRRKHGAIDNLVILEQVDDVAHVQWGEWVADANMRRV